MDYMAGSVSWYLLTYFGRVWLRLVLAIVAPTDLFLLWTRGRSQAVEAVKYTSVSALVIAAISTIAFAASPDNQEVSRYACWYRYGSSQIHFDLVMIIMGMVYKIFVLAWVVCKPPSCAGPLSLSSCHSSSSNQDHDQDQLELEWQQNNPSKADPTTSTTSDRTRSTDTDMDSDSAIDSAMKVRSSSNGLSQEKIARKCGISGDYVYRLKLLIGVYVASSFFQILTSISALGSSASVQSKSPIVDLLQLLNIFIYDGTGLIICLIFHSMATNGWVLMQVRACVRQPTKPLLTLIYSIYSIYSIL